MQQSKTIPRENSSSNIIGAVCINDTILQLTHPDLPFGGVNHSGIGKAHGKYGFMAFSNEKPVLKQKSGFAISYVLHPPYSVLKKKILDWMIQWF
ncbi:MAG: aldehyde dehydrogenase family protein [Bacteroidetes bacterium]|nr:aldehyde dehydrogenase family protein [Bacteroidota bacterium]